MPVYRLTEAKDFKTPTEINKMTEKEAKDYIKEIRKEVYKRNNALIKEGLAPLSHIPNTTIRGKSLPRLKKTIGNIRNYLTSKTTTVEGAKETYELYRDQLGGYADDLSYRNIGNIYKMYDKMVEAHSNVYQGGSKGKNGKYRNAYLIAIATIQRADRRLNNSDNTALIEAIYTEVESHLRGDKLIVTDENGKPVLQKDKNGNEIQGAYIYEDVETYFMKRKNDFVRIGRK